MNEDTLNNNYSDILSYLDDEAERYASEMIEELKGNRDFIIKQLDYNHKMALGEDDTARAEFFEKVANAVEKQIGRIPYDYEKYTSRELEDYALTEEKVLKNTEKALTRLEEDDKVLQQQTKLTQDSETQSQNELLNSQGLISGTRENATGIAGRRVGQLDKAHATELETIATEKARNIQDLNDSKEEELQTAALARDRNIEDLTDQARRDAQDAQSTFDFGVEGANREYESSKKQVERNKQKELNSNLATARSLAYYGN